MFFIATWDLVDLPCPRIETSWSGAPCLARRPYSSIRCQSLDSPKLLLCTLQSCRAKYRRPRRALYVPLLYCSCNPMKRESPNREGPRRSTRKSEIAEAEDSASWLGCQSRITNHEHPTLGKQCLHTIETAEQHIAGGENTVPICSHDTAIRDHLRSTAELRVLHQGCVDISLQTRW